MSSSKLRRQIAWDAARLMYSREVSEYYAAKPKAARRLCKGWLKPAALPTNAEIREQVQLLIRLHEGPEPHAKRLLAMRMRAVWWMRRLAAFHPQLIGMVAYREQTWTIWTRFWITSRGLKRCLAIRNSQENLGVAVDFGATLSIRPD